MHTKVAILLFSIVVLAACGGSAPGQTPGSIGATPAPAATSGPAGGGGAVDCAAMKSAAEALIGIQLLAQLRSPESIESIKSLGTLDLDAMLAALDELHALDGFAGPLGDPKTSIDHYEKAAAAAKALFDMDPVTQAAIDAFNDEHVGTIGDFLGKQIAISGAMDEADC
jgi:hypothetical protein